MSPDGFLAGTSLDAAAFVDPLGTVSVNDELQLIRNLLTHCGNPPGLGLEVGRHYRFTSLAAVGFAIASSPSLRVAFDMTQRYATLRPSLVELTIEPGVGDLCATFRPSSLPAGVCRFAVERSVAAVLAVTTDLLGRPLQPVAIDLAFSRPADIQTYEALGATPAFEKPESRLVLRQADVDMPLQLGNALALKTAEEKCQQLMRAIPNHSRIAVRVREHLARRPDRLEPSNVVAAALGMTVSTLRRALQDEGSSYLMLCDEVRATYAERLLHMPWLPIDTVAEQLGYSEIASFVRAFKRWKGRTPQAYRARPD